MKERLIQDLSKVFEKNQILTSDLYREIYSRDGSYFNIKPEVIVRPENAAEVQQLLAIARSHKVGITFRTGGTSLSGQTVNDGIICELRTAWKRNEVRENGKKIWFEPGLTAAQVNKLLRTYQTKIGPDPASAVAAMMGGILSNNSSGMQTGTRYNAYHTLNSIEFMLANGHWYNSGSVEDRTRFEETERELCQGLTEIRREILNKEILRNRIVEKYKIKNVTGYSVNAFVDFEHPMDIFAHLLIGAEGTLGFIISAELNTLPLLPVYSSAMLYFENATLAAAAAPLIGDSGAVAVEMMDYASLASLGSGKMDLPSGTTALLIDYGASGSEEMRVKIAELNPALRRLKGMVQMKDFTHTVAERERLWEIRDGIFPCVAGARIPGDAVILEDVAAPVDRLYLLVDGLQQLFRKYGYEGAVFGHARDGNLHPLITSGMRDRKEVGNFAYFMEGMVELVLSLNGSLKGEHGTGRAVAPFVEREWGSEIYGMMQRLKKLADPQGILNKGVIINSDPEAHLHPLKEMTLFGADFDYEKADTCIECGYCEHVCPSRNVTLTPRQRLQARRIIKREGDKELEKQYDYIGEKTCAVDGMCQLPCPMGINTGIVTDALRVKKAGKEETKIMLYAAEHFEATEKEIRGALKLAVGAEKVLSPYPFIWATDFLHKLIQQFPHWSEHFPMPRKLSFREEAEPDFIYFPSCVTRIFGASTLKKEDLMSVILRLADKAGIKVRLPEKVQGLCCSQIWGHKGNPEGQKWMANRTIESFYKWTDQGRIPVFCDTTSCTHTLLYETGEKILTLGNFEKYQKLKILDITEWLKDYILPKAERIRPKNRILLHPTCACRIMELVPAMLEIAHQCAKDVVLPENWGCCGASGDRGFIFPELSESATREESHEITSQKFDGCYSLARTCEIVMQDHIKQPYESIAYLVDETAIF